MWRCLELVLHAIRNAIRVHSISPLAHPLYVCAAEPGPREPLGMPVRNPFFALRAMVLSVRMRPVPVVFLLFAFSLQLSVRVLSVLAPGTTGSELGDRRYGRRMGGGPTLPDAGARVSAVRAGVLLYVEGSLAWREYQYPSNNHHFPTYEHTATSAQNVRLVVPFSETSRTLGCAKAVSILRSIATIQYTTYSCWRYWAMRSVVIRRSLSLARSFDVVGASKSLAEVGSLRCGVPSR